MDYTPDPRVLECCRRWGIKVKYDNYGDEGGGFYNFYIDDKADIGDDERALLVLELIFSGKKFKSFCLTEQIVINEIKRGKFEGWMEWYWERWAQQYEEE